MKEVASQGVAPVGDCTLRTRSRCLLRVCVLRARRWNCWRSTVVERDRRRIHRQFFCGLLNPFFYGRWVLAELLCLIVRCARRLARRSFGGIADGRLLTLQWKREPQGGYQDEGHPLTSLHCTLLQMVQRLHDHEFLHVA